MMKIIIGKMVKEDDWFVESVKYVTNNNLMNGIGDNKFSPKGTASRAEVATMLMRFMEN